MEDTALAQTNKLHSWQQCSVLEKPRSMHALKQAARLPSRPPPPAHLTRLATDMAATRRGWVQPTSPYVV